jgi:2-phospho-L-lactate guanylyltransferase
MLEDVLAVLSDTVATYVVTSDPIVEGIAKEAGVGKIQTNDAGETAVVRTAMAELEREGRDGVLVIPADVPLITSEEVAQVIVCCPKPGAVLVPSRSGRGTNAVLQAPPGLFQLKFGEDSFPPHVSRARASGMRYEVLELHAIGLDIDESDDLRELNLRSGNSRAKDYLCESGIVERIIANECV